MGLLVSKKYIQSNTHIWNDFKTSETNKGTIISVIKYIGLQGYYKQKFTKPSNKQIRLIAINTFKVDIAESTIKQHKINDIEVRFILPASTVK